MELNVNMPGFRTYLKDDGNYEILISPSELPFEHGIAVYEVKCESDLNQFKQNNKKKHCFSIVYLDNESSTNLFNQLTCGDTFITLEKNEKYNIRINDREYEINLIKNENNRLGLIKITIDDIKTDFKFAQEIMFNVINHVINMISITYGTPIRFSSFIVNYEILNFFTVVEAKPKYKSSSCNLLLSVGKNSDKWNIAINNFRRALLSKDPQSKFIFLFVGCEMLRSLIKDMIGLDENQNNIKGKGYTEPIIKGVYEFNTNPIYRIKGKTYASVLFGTFKKLRNATAHHQLYDGTYKNLSNLKDYIEFYSSIPYLIEIFEGYLFELDKLNQRSSK